MACQRYQRVQQNLEDAQKLTGVGSWEWDHWLQLVPAWTEATTALNRATSASLRGDGVLPSLRTPDHDDQLPSWHSGHLEKRG
jgi:hypothetical protein